MGLCKILKNLKDYFFLAWNTTCAVFGSCKAAHIFLEYNLTLNTFSNLEKADGHLFLAGRSIFVYSEQHEKYVHRRIIWRNLGNHWHKNASSMKQTPKYALILENSLIIGNHGLIVIVNPHSFRVQLKLTLEDSVRLYNTSVQTTKETASLNLFLKLVPFWKRSFSMCRPDFTTHATVNISS